MFWAVWQRGCGKALSVTVKLYTRAKWTDIYFHQRREGALWNHGINCSDFTGATMRMTWRVVRWWGWGFSALVPLMSVWFPRLLTLSRSLCNQPFVLCLTGASGSRMSRRILVGLWRLRPTKTFGRPCFFFLLATRYWSCTTKSQFQSKVVLFYCPILYLLALCWMCVRWTRPSPNDSRDDTPATPEHDTLWWIIDGWDICVGIYLVRFPDFSQSSTTGSLLFNFWNISAYSLTTDSKNSYRGWRFSFFMSLRRLSWSQNVTQLWNIQFIWALTAGVKDD